MSERPESHGARVHALAAAFVEAAEAVVERHDADGAEMMLAMATALGLCIGKSARPGRAGILIRAAQEIVRATARLNEGREHARFN